jgi:methionine-gamma-lyase
VGTVYYPGLEAHPDFELASAQMSGFGGLLSFEVLGGAPAAERLLEALELSTRAASLGSVHTLATRPAAMWADERNYDASAHESVAPGLVRMAVGIESTADLVADVLGALDKVGDDADGG